MMIVLFIIWATPYWTVSFSVTADDIANQTAIPIYCCYRSYASADGGVESTYEHACGSSNLKAVYYNGVDITSSLTDVTIIGSTTNKPGKAYTFDASEEAGIKEFVFVFTDSYHAPTACWCDCTKLVSAVCSKAVEVIPAQIFYNTNVESITVGKAVTFIGQQLQTTPVFKSLKFEDGGTEPLITGKQMIASFGGSEIILPDRTKIVGYDMVHSSSTLKKVVFGKNVTDIGQKIPLTGDSYTYEGRVFLTCSVLDTIIFKSTTPPTWHHDADNISGAAADHIFQNCAKIANKTAHIYVPAASVDLYKAADGFSEYADMIEANPDE